MSLKVKNYEISNIVVVHKDGLSRSGFDLINWWCEIVEDILVKIASSTFFQALETSFKSQGIYFLTLGCKRGGVCADTKRESRKAALQKMM